MSERIYTKSLELVCDRFQKEFPAISFRDNEPYYWLVDEIAKLVEAENARLRVALEQADAMLLICREAIRHPMIDAALSHVQGALRGGQDD